MTKLLVKELKGYTFRLLDLETYKTFRAHKNEFDLTIGSLLTVDDIELFNDLITKMNVTSEIVGDSTKERIKVFIDEVKIGDLIDGVPILNFGQNWAEKGRKVSYAYFK